MTAQVSGYNPMRWDCREHGCFNYLKRPKIELFAECFPGNIGLSDIDGIVEIAGQGLMVEWKPAAITMIGGQHLMFTRLSKHGLTVFVIAGNAKTMDVTHLAYYFQGRWYPWKPHTLADIKDRMRRWCRHAQESPWQAEASR